MTNRLWGNDLSDEEMPFAVSYIHGYSGGVVGNNSVGALALGSYSMPWAGSLSATLTMSASWGQSGHQQWYVHFGNSSPGPNYNSVLTQVALNNITTMRGQLPAYATWQNLVKNQGVNLNVNIGVGGGGWNLTIEWWVLTLRAWPG